MCASLHMPPRGECRILVTKDEKVLHAAALKMHREDHTLGNLLRMYVPCSTASCDEVRHQLCWRLC